MQKAIILDRLTTKILGEMKLGERLTFKLPSAIACDNAKSLVAVVGRRTGFMFRVSTNYDECLLTITKELR